MPYRVVKPPGRREDTMNSRFEKFTERVRRALGEAQEEARRTGSENIEPRHIAAQILGEKRAVAPRALALLETDPAEVMAELQDGGKPDSNRTSLALSEKSRDIVRLAVEEAVRMEHTYVGTEHFLLAFIREGENPMAEAMARREITAERAREAIGGIIGKKDRTGE